MIIGAFAGVIYGITRITYDVDMVVDLKDAQIEAFVQEFPPPRYYADSEQIKESIRMGILFNIIDTSAGNKVDLIPLTMEPGYNFALMNRIRRRIPFSDVDGTEAWFANQKMLLSVS